MSWSSLIVCYQNGGLTLGPDLHLNQQICRVSVCQKHLHLHQHQHLNLHLNLHLNQQICRVSVCHQHKAAFTPQALQLSNWPWLLLFLNLCREIFLNLCKEIFLNLCREILFLNICKKKYCFLNRCTFTHILKILLCICTHFNNILVHTLTAFTPQVDKPTFQCLRLGVSHLHTFLRLISHLPMVE